MQLHDLGAVHQALATEGDQIRLGRTPVRQRRRPLPGPAQIEDLLARLDHGAVDDPRNDRRHFTGLNGDHDLIQQRHARGRLAQRDHGPTKTKPAKRDQVRVAQSPKRDPEHAILELRHELHRGFNGEPRLPGTSRAGEAEETCAVTKK